AWPTVAVDAQGILLNGTALEAASRMFAAGSAYPYCLSSGYRSFDEQAQTYNDSSDKSYVQPPGHSEHETGLALDIMATDAKTSAQATSQENNWLADNAWRFGFILRYPQGKEGITGISFEPWHFRYIGLPHAAFCYQNNLCLEEYIQFLKSNGGYSITLDGKEYSVYYEMPEDGIIEVPANAAYEVSSDNTGGYIVTTWGD
ncbi:MAG: M15 family metallopeptidase, partial [Eggerthellaceae bacterium]|nr:M15 family metallopeptidase [Eggerthellaceae bacterium]